MDEEGDYADPDPTPGWPPPLWQVAVLVLGTVSAFGLMVGLIQALVRFLRS
jgi:hypothetical protein